MFGPGGDMHSLSPQQPALGTHWVVPGQFLKPLAHITPQVPPLQTAVPFDAGAPHMLQPVPQNVVLLSG